VTEICQLVCFVVIAFVCGVVIGRALAGIVFKDDNRKD